MTLEKLQSDLRSADLVPVIVKNHPPSSEHKRLMFAGQLAEFVEVAKALQSRIVIVCSESLEESDFLAEEAERDAEVSETSSIDLCSVNAKLARFREYLGKTGLIWVSLPMQGDYIDLALEETWWSEFLDMRDETIERIAMEREHHEATERARVIAKSEETLMRLRALIDDTKFANLPTQKAMLQYALRKIPELKDLEQGGLRSEIQELKARIDAGVD